MPEITVTPQEYKKKVSTVEAIQWDGSLASVQDVLDWVLLKDEKSTLNAKFTSAGIRLEISSQGQTMQLGLGDYLAYGEDFGLASFTQEDFSAIYEVA